jgi:hypothetical protein
MAQVQVDLLFPVVRTTVIPAFELVCAVGLTLYDANQGETMRTVHIAGWLVPLGNRSAQRTVKLLLHSSPHASDSVMLPSTACLVHCSLQADCSNTDESSMQANSTSTRLQDASETLKQLSCSHKEGQILLHGWEGPIERPEGV